MHFARIAPFLPHTGRHFALVYPFLSLVSFLKKFFLFPNKQ